MRTLSESWLAAERAMGGRHVPHGTAAELRKQSEAMVAAISPHGSPSSGNVETKDVEAGSVSIRTYMPKNATGPLPVGIHAHGGGYVLGDIETEDMLVQNIAEHGNFAMISVEYRLAPEHKAPAQLEDMVKAANWVAANASTFGGDPNRIFTSGTSAGGGLALSLARKIMLGQTNVEPKALKGISALVPVALHPDYVPESYKSRYTAYEENARDVPMLDKSSMKSFFRETGISPTDESYLTALDPETFSKYPPTAIVTCEFDPLRDDGKIMVEELQKAGVPTKLDHWDGFPHCFWMAPGIPESKTFLQHLLANLAWLRSQM